MTKQIWVADCETDPFKYGRVPVPFVWECYTKLEGVEVFKVFYDTNDFMEFMTKQNGIVYAHNGGKFDWHFILDWITPNQECKIINGRLSQFTIGECEFRDSYNILPVALGAYKKDDFDYEKMESKNRNNHKDEILKYLHSDCVYLYEIVMRFIEDYGLHLTLATAALKTWQKISGIKAPETDEIYYRKLKKYYYGGRVECFQSGEIKQDFKVVDINSAYPFAMYERHPYGQQPFKIYELPKTDAEIKKIFITIRCISYGALPFRADDGSLSFPRDEVRREYSITGHEYVTAINTETIKKVKIIEMICFTKSIHFQSYIDHFYALKTSSKIAKDDAGYLLSKLFLNSLYGKFASNPLKYSNFMFVRPQHIEAVEADGYSFNGMIGRWALVKKPLDEDEMTFYDLAVGASITGFVRAFMWESITKCEGVMYCDTDSIAALDTSKLEYHPTALGKWDIEAECDYGAIAGKKMYAFRDKKGKWKTPSKGVRFTHTEIIKVAQKEQVNYENIAPTFSVRKDPTFVKRKVAFNAKIN